MMHPKTIISLMYEHEHPPGIVARNLNVKRATVSEVIHNNKRSYNIATYISAVTKTSLKKLWGDVYTFSPKKPITHAYASQFKKNLEAA